MSTWPKSHNGFFFDGGSVTFMALQHAFIKRKSELSIPRLCKVALWFSYTIVTIMVAQEVTITTFNISVNVFLETFLMPHYPNET